VATLTAVEVAVAVEVLAPGAACVVAVEAAVGAESPLECEALTAAVDGEAVEMAEFVTVEALCPALLAWVEAV